MNINLEKLNQMTKEELIALSIYLADIIAYIPKYFIQARNEINHCQGGIEYITQILRTQPEKCLEVVQKMEKELGEKLQELKL